MNDELLTVEQVADRLNASHSAIRKWLANGDLVGIKLAGTRWRIPETALREFLDHAAATAKAEVKQNVTG